MTTEWDARRIAEIRAASRVLACIGAWATAAGSRALGNFADVAEFTSVVYAHPQYISTLAHLDAGVRPRRGRFSSCADARSTRVSSSSC